MSTRPEQAAVLSDLVETWATPEPNDPAWCLEIAAYLGQARCFAPQDPTVHAAQAWLGEHRAQVIQAWHATAQQDATLEALSALYAELDPTPEELLDHVLNADALLAAAEALGQPALAGQLAGALEDLLSSRPPVTAQLAEAARRTLQWLRPEGERRALWQAILDAQSFEQTPAPDAEEPPWLAGLLAAQPGPELVNLAAVRALREVTSQPTAAVTEGWRALANPGVTVAIPDATSLWRSPDGRLELMLEPGPEGDQLALYGDGDLPRLEIIEPPLGDAEIINAFTRRIRLPTGQGTIRLKLGDHRVDISL